MPKHHLNGSKDMQMTMVITELMHWQMKEETATHKWSWMRKSGMTTTLHYKMAQDYKP